MKRDLDHNNEPGILKYPKGLTRIFHTDSAAACEHLMDTASALNCSSGSVYTHSRRQTSSLALPHQPSRPPRHDQYEISGLARIFHTDLLQRPGSQIDAALISKSSSGSVYTHSRRQTSLLALPHQPSQPPRHDQYEISGLGIACIALSTVLFLTSCAHRLPTYEKPLARAALQKVRTTAYTHSESGHHRYGARSALGTPLKYGAANSAAADWARWPAGTRFRIKATGENFIVDDYGFALAGTNTIDLYKPTPKGMSEWGVRRVTIEIIEWGDPWRSYMLLSKVKGYRHIHRMLQEIRKFFPQEKSA